MRIREKGVALTATTEVWSKSSKLRRIISKGSTLFPLLFFSFLFLIVIHFNGIQMFHYFSYQLGKLHYSYFQSCQNTKLSSDSLSPIFSKVLNFFFLITLMGWHLNKESQDSEVQLLLVYAKLFSALMCVHVGSCTYILRMLYFNFSSVLSTFVKNQKFVSGFNFQYLHSLLLD